MIMCVAVVEGPFWPGLGERLDSPPTLMPYATLYQCLSHPSSSVKFSPILTPKYEIVNKTRSSMSLSKHFKDE